MANRRQFPVVGPGEVDADKGRGQVDFLVMDVDPEGIVVLGVPLPALKLKFLGDFRESGGGHGHVGGEWVVQAVDRSLAQTGQDDVDGLQGGGGHHPGEQAGVGGGACVVRQGDGGGCGGDGG